MTDLAVFVLVSIPAFVVIGFSVVDIVRRGDLQLWAKAGWLVTVALLPAIGTVIYLLARPVRGPRISEGSERSRELIETIRLHDHGLMTDADYAAAKRQLITDLTAGPGT